MKKKILTAAFTLLSLSALPALAATSTVAALVEQAAALPPSATPQRSADAFATDTAMADYVFSWAEKNMSSYFAPANPPSQSSSGFYFRQYKNSTFLAEQNGTLYLLYSGKLVPVGKLSDFAATIGYKPTTTTPNTASMTVGQAVDYEFIRATILWQIDNASYTGDMSSVSVSSSGSSVSGIVSIKVNTSVSPNSPGYVTLQCYKCHNWKLTAAQYSQFATAMSTDAYVTGSMTYMNNDDLNGYISYTQSQADKYNGLVSQIPASFSTYWY